MYGEEKVMATSSDEGKQTRTLLDFNFVNRRKFDEEQDKNDQSSDRGKTCFMFCEAFPYFFGTSGKIFLTILIKLYSFAYSPNLFFPVSRSQMLFFSFILFWYSVRKYKLKYND